MKHLSFFSVATGLVVAGLALFMLQTGHTAVVAESGLKKFMTVVLAVCLFGVLVRVVAGGLDRRAAKRWIVSAHPVTWLLVSISVGMGLGLGAMVLHRAQRPSEHGDWSIGIYVSEGKEPAGFKPMGPQPVITSAHVTDIPCSFVADPVLVREGDRYLLFYEAWNTRSGHGDICLSMSRDGLFWEYQGRVLDESVSLSYPTVFFHEDHWYMIPETRAMKQLRLYRATNFPHEWTFDRILLKGERYRDTNILAHEGRWYLFTVPDWGERLLVFHSPTPFGPWESHPMNPLTEHQDHLRGGGSLIRHGADLLRFSQDVRPYYGNRVRAARIDQLTPTAFNQSPVGAEPVLFGHDSWNTMGMHTLWCVGHDDGRWLAAVDGHGRVVNTKPSLKFW